MVSRTAVRADRGSVRMRRQTARPNDVSSGRNAVNSGRNGPESERSDRYSLVATLIADLARAMPAALAAGVLPGYFWACFLRRTDGLAERLTYSTALSLAIVPAIAIGLARILGTGISLGVGYRHGAADRLRLRRAGLPDLGYRGRPRARAAARAAPPGGHPRRPGTGLITVAIGLALAMALGLPTPGWLLRCDPGRAGGGRAAGPGPGAARRSSRRRTRARRSWPPPPTRRPVVPQRLVPWKLMPRQLASP